MVGRVKKKGKEGRTRYKVKVLSWKKVKGHRDSDSDTGKYKGNGKEQPLSPNPNSHPHRCRGF